jgi:hypothetical protein
MLLKDVRLYMNRDQFPQAMRSEFRFRSCYISNYLTRRVRELRLSRDFRGILIQGCAVISAPGLSEMDLIVPVGFSSADYAALRPGEEHEFFIAMIAEGIERCAQEHSIPVAELMTTLEEFRRGGYRNEWTHQRKLLRPVGMHASLLCSLDTERFLLVLKLERKGVTVFEQQILETQPDEIMFSHRFKEVVLEGDAVVVKDRFGRVLFSMPVPAS